MKHAWQQSFKGYRGETLTEITYVCKTCPEIHFKTVSPDDTKFLASINQDSKVQGSWSRTNSVEREHFSKDILQPYQKDGTVNEKFLKSYGKQAYQNWGESNPQPHKRKSW